MRTQAYKLTGKEVPAALAGTVITLRIPENYREAESLTKNGESDVVAKFADGIVIALQGGLRTRSGKKDKATGALIETPASLQKYASEYVYTVQAEGVAREVTPKTKQDKAAIGLGNRIFERALTDEKFRSTMEKNGMLDGFDEWKSARAAVAGVAGNGASAGKPAPVAAAV